MAPAVAQRKGFCAELKFEEEMARKRSRAEKKRCLENPILCAFCAVDTERK